MSDFSPSRCEITKPIITSYGRENVVSDINQAKGVLEDYDELVTDYQNLQKLKSYAFW